MKYVFIQNHQEEFCIGRMCRVLLVSRSAYYDGLNRKPSTRQRANEALDARIKNLFDEHKSRYGSPRITINYSWRVSFAVKAV